MLHPRRWITAPAVVAVLYAELAQFKGGPASGPPRLPRGPDRVRGDISAPAAGILQRVAVTIPLGAITAIAARLLRIPATAG